MQRPNFDLSVRKSDAEVLAFGLPVLFLVDVYKRQVLSLHKTVRKYFGEAIVVTQEVEDIISSPIVKESIINNADCKILDVYKRQLTG